MILPLSIAYISYNEEHIIAESLAQSSKIASQIVVVDSFSNDKTVEIARSFGAQIFSEEWKGYARQKNSAIEKCTYDWILLLDCDEVLSNSLISEIQEIVNKNIPGIYSINRKTVYLGKKMDFCWQPDRVIRLVHKSLKPIFADSHVHEKLTFQISNTIKLKNDLIHFSYKDINHHFTKTFKYANLSATDYFKQGRKSSLLKMIVNPLFAFINMYFIKLGFLDGWRGLVAAFSSMTGTFLKYAELKYQNDKSYNDN